METKKRSIVKGFTYRFLATIATGLVAYGFTKDIGSSIQIGSFDFVVKLTLYYVNDRFWNRIKWGYTYKGKVQLIRKK